jgi:Pectate lyase
MGFSVTSFISYSASAVVVEENTLGFCGAEGVLQSIYSGYTGEGYIDIANQGGAGIDYQISVPSQGSYTLTFRYAALESTGMSVRVNGSSGSFPFSRTSSWSDWQEASRNYTLKAGVNTVRVQNTGSSARPNIDSLTVSGDAEAVFCGYGGSSSSSSSSSSSDASSSDTSSSNSSASTSSSSSSVGTVAPELEGFGTVSGNGGYNLTGGSGGETVTVSDFAALVAAVADDAPRTVQISGTVSGDGTAMVRVGSNKTIVGLGSSGMIDGFGFNVSGWDSELSGLYGGTCGAEQQPYARDRQNVIIQNLTFINAIDDSVNVECYAHNVWIDHNTFTAAYDGSVDIKRGADFVTVSWNKFQSTSKTMLLGHSDGNGDQDRGYLHVSYHHNMFEYTGQRHPRVRFGQAHVYNNYVVHISAYFIGLGVECDIYADGNYIEFADAVTEGYGGSDITWHSSNIVVETDNAPTSNGQGFNPNDYYSYNLDNAADIPSIVGGAAGAGKINASSSSSLSSSLSFFFVQL